MTLEIHEENMKEERYVVDLESSMMMLMRLRVS